MRTFIIIGIAAAISFFAAGVAHAAERIQAVPLIDHGFVNRLPAPIQNLIETGTALNKSASTLTPPTLSGKGEELSQMAQRILRAAITFIIAAVAWLITHATQLVAWIAAVTIGIINWLISLVRAL